MLIFFLVKMGFIWNKNSIPKSKTKKHETEQAIYSKKWYPILFCSIFFIVYSKSIDELILPKNAFKCCCTWQFNVLCALDITYHYQINERNTNTCYLRKKMWVCPWLKIVLILFLLFKTIIRIFYFKKCHFLTIC